MDKVLVRYPDGLQMGQFKRIDEISHYNYNYYVGFDQDLLLAESDDDNTTEWFLIRNRRFHYLGESYVTNDDRLNRYDRPCT